MRSLAVVWAIGCGLMVVIPGLALVWSSRSPAMRRLRWPLLWLSVAYLIATAMLLIAVKS